MGREKYTVKILTEVEDFINILDKATVVKILKSKWLLGEFGSTLGMPRSKRISKNLYELRIRGKQEIRIFYTFKNNIIILFYAFSKKSQKTPKHILSQVNKILRELD